MCRVSDNDNCIHQRIRCFVFRRARQRSRWNNLFLMLNSLFATLNLKVMGAIVCFSLYFCICFVIILFLLFEVVACIAHMCMGIYMHVCTWVCLWCTEFKPFCSLILLFTCLTTSIKSSNQWIFHMYIHVCTMSLENIFLERRPHVYIQSTLAHRAQPNPGETGSADRYVPYCTCKQLTQGILRYRERRRSTVFLERMREGHHQSDEHWNCLKAVLEKLLEDGVECIWAFSKYWYHNWTERLWVMGHNLYLKKYKVEVMCPCLQREII